MYMSASRKLAAGARQDFSYQRWGAPYEGQAPESNAMVQLYRSLDEEGTVYVKIDDDVVYLAPHALANMVRERRRNRCTLVSASAGCARCSSGGRSRAGRA